MKEFKSKGISLENMVGADPMKEEKNRRNFTISILES